MSISAIQLLQAFNLNTIVQQAYHKDLQEKRMKREQSQKLTVGYVMTERGFALVELFGYHFSRQIKESMYEIGKKNNLIRANYQDYYKVMTQQWVNMKQYNLFLPVLFKMLKGYNNTISFKDIDRYLQICKSNLSPLTVQLKQKIPPSKIQQMIQELEALCEKQDLKGSGYIQKILVVDLIKKYIGEKENIEIDEKLVKNDELDYGKLLSQQYLRAGGQIKELFKQFFLRKVLKVIKRIGKLKKEKKKKIQVVRRASSIPTKKKQTKNEKLVREYIQENKKQMKQDRKKIQYIAKSLVYQCIFAVLELNPQKQVKLEKTSVLKSVYTAQPCIIQHQIITNDFQSIKMYPGPNGTAIFVSDGKGKFLNLLNGAISYDFNLKPSAIFKNSPIVDYLYFNDNLIGIRQDGLLFSWGTQQKSYTHVVQTQYRFVSKKLEHLNPRKILFVSQGLLVVNQCQINSNLSIYSLELQLLGRLNLKKQQFGIKLCILSQTVALLELAQSLPRDSWIKSQQYLQSSIRSSYHQQEFTLTSYFFKKYNEFSILKMEDYLNWISSYRINNTIYLDKHLVARLKRKQPTKDDYQYLVKYQYIKQDNLKAIQVFLATHSIKEVIKQQRQSFLYTLFEDNAMKQIQSPYISRQEFFQWIERCSLNPEKVQKLLANLQFDCQAKICMSKFIKSEQYLKILSLQNDRFMSPQKYKFNSLPPILLNEVLPLPALDIFLIVPLFPFYNQLFVISVNNVTLNRIDLSAYSQQNTNSSPILTYCSQTGYFFLCYANVITIWSIHKISQKKCQPIKIIKQLELISKPIIGINILYYSNSFATLTKQALKIWDLDQLLFSPESADIVFQIKPGFKAIQKRSGVCRWQLKKKIYVRGKGESLVSFPTKHSNYVVALLSRGEKASNYYLKLFYLSKFKVKIRQDKIYQQIPLKLTRLLQQQAQKNKYSDSVITPQKTNQAEEQLSLTISKDYKQKLNQSTASSNSHSCVILISKLQHYCNLFQQYSKIMQAKMRAILKEVTDPKYIKYNLIVKLHITQKQSELEQIFQHQFLQFYKDQNGKVDRRQIIDDLFEWQDKSFLNRLLCLSSLIYKYGRQYLCGYAQIVSDPAHQGLLDLKSVEMLLSQSQMSKSIIIQTISLLNNIKIGQPLNVLKQIIDKFLPTNYRFPSVRYYKTILAHSPQNPSDYFINRFQDYADLSLKEALLAPHKYKHILEHIQKQRLLQKITEITEKYPQILKDNLHLIDFCMSYNFITEENATFYFLNLPNISLVNIIKQVQTKVKPKLNLDQVIQQIAYALNNSKKKIPTPNFSYQYFYDLTKSILQNDDLIYSLFFQVLNGSLLQHVAYSNQLQFLIDMNKKKVAIDYYPLHWKEMIGSRIYPLAQHISFIKQNIADKKLIKSPAFQQILTQVVPKHANNLAMRFSFASLNPNNYQSDFSEQKSSKTYNSMFINTQHMLKYLEQSKRDRESKVNNLPSKFQKRKAIELKIPSYFLLNHLSKTGALITYQSFIELISFNMNEFSYGEIMNWIKTIPFRTIKNKDGSQSRVCGIWQIKKLLKLDYTMLGWMLLIKYNKLGILSKCIVVEGFIDVKQLNQVFLSESIFRLLIQSNKQLQIQQTGVRLQQLQLMLQKQIIGPSLQKLSQIFKSIVKTELPNISCIFDEIAKSNDEIQLDKFVKYFLPSNQYKQIMVKMAIIGIIGKNKKIKAKQTLAKIVSFVNYQNYQEVNPLSKWIDATQNSKHSLLQLVCEVISPHAITFNKQLKLQNVRIAQQHLSDLIGQTVQWVFSLNPTLTLSQFFNYLIDLKNQNGKLPQIIGNCVLKLGLHNFLSSFNNASFAQYYSKCKSVSKSMAKLTAFEFSITFRRLSQPVKGISVLKMFKLAQYEINPEERIKYIMQYKQKQEESPLDISSLRVSNLLQISSQSIVQLASVVNVLNYQEYLIKRYLKSANKLASVLKNLDNTQSIFNLLNQINLSQSQINILVKYLKTYGEESLEKYREAQNKVSGDIDKYEQILLIQNVSQYFQFFRKKMDLEKNQSFNCNFQIKEQLILQTSLYKRMQRQLSPQWSCLKSYINLYHYCQHLLVNVIFKKAYYQRLIKDQINQSLSKLSLSLRNIYDVLGLAYQQNLQKYLPFLIAPAPNHHALQARLFQSLSAYLFQSFVKYSQNTQNKYPLNFNAFKQLFSQNDLKTQEEKVDHGQIFKKLNIWGCGYVNVNDIPYFREKNTINPYIEINTYINLNYPIVKSWKKIKPPQQITKHRETVINELFQLEQPGSMKQKIIKFDNLWRILGYYLSEEHRLYIQHQFKSVKLKDYYDIVKLIFWISQGQNSQQQEKGPTILQKTVDAIQEKGGVYNIIRQYQKQILMAQQVDSYNQQFSFLLSFLDSTNRLESQQLIQVVNTLIKQNKIQAYVQSSLAKQSIEKLQNKNWLLEALILIVNTYNRQVREWMNYNNNLVKFLNQLTMNQFNLLKKLYHNNWEHSYHRLFGIMANGSNYFTFSTFWVYNTNNDEAYPYTKDEVKKVYQIIDVNSDGNISYQQFSRFWCAVGQIFENPLQPASTAIYKLKNEIVQLFLLLLQPLIDKGMEFESEQMNLPALESLTNIKNRQKIQQLVKLISQEDQVRLKLDLHKLKVMLKQLKVKKFKEKFEQIRHQNYFAKCFGRNIKSFIEYKDSLQCLGKWLYFTYPTYGGLLTQYFYEEFNQNKQAITKWINEYTQSSSQQQVQQVSPRLVNPNIQTKHLQFYNQVRSIPNFFYKFYKKNNRKAAQIKKYGESISQNLYLTKVLKDYELVLLEINQIQYFLETSLENEHLALIYPIEPDKNWRYGDEVDKKDRYFQENLKKIVFENESQQIQVSLNISCLVWKKDSYLRRQYTLLNNEFRGKSNNRFSLLTHKNLYQDRLISISVIDQQRSNASQLFIFSDYTDHKPLMQLRLADCTKFQSIITMIRLVQLALYLQQNYRLAGLFADPSLLCIDILGQKDFKFSNFYAAIKLDQEGNYVQGASPLQLTNTHKNLIIPPQTYQEVYTQTFDSYCIAHILYYFFTGEFISNSGNTASTQQSLWCNYSLLHHKCIKNIEFLAQQEKNIEIEAEIVFFTLLYECTHYQWHLRPKIFQILQTMQTISQMVVNNLENIGKQLIIRPTVPQCCLKAISQKDYEFLSQFYAKNQYPWSVKELQEIRVAIPNQSKYYSLFSQMLLKKLKQLTQNYTLQQIEQFMKMSVEYVCGSDKKNTAYYALQTYKDLISSEIVKRYFDYCDQLWKINEFNIQEKLKQLNMQDRINKLPKSSQYYFDISTLVDSKIILYLCQYQLKVKKSDSTKKIALSFIESSLISNNVNKISAVYKSEVVKNLYKYIEDKQFGATVMKIYSLITVCLNQDANIDVHRTIEQGYKVMMVMHNIINLEKGVKKGETVVQMLTFMNNYYNFYGQQCKSVALRQICHEHVCNLPTLSFLFNTKTANIEYVYQILLNLTYDQGYYKKLKLTTIRAYETHLRDIKKQAKFSQLSTKLQGLIKKHEFKYSLLQIEIQTNAMQSRIECASKSQLNLCYTQLQDLIDRHIVFFMKKNDKCSQKGLDYKFQNNFNEHFTNFLAFTRKLSLKQLQNAQLNFQTCNLVQRIINFHNQLFDFWHSQDKTIRFILTLVQKIYEKEYLYHENLLLNSIEKPIFQIIIRLIGCQKRKLLNFGFIHLFFRIMKRQHELTELYISKKVQNLQLKTTYVQQAQFRLNVIHKLLQTQELEIHRMFIVVGFGKYLVQYMFSSKVILDLRYYKSTFNLVPFRFCNPLRSEAITMLSSILPRIQSPLKSEIVSRLIPLVIQEKLKLQQYAEMPDAKMRFVQTLWLFGNLIECQDERLRYQMVNNGSYAVINKLIQKHSLLSQFFPKMSETIKTGSILKSSIVFSKLLQK